MEQVLTFRLESENYGLEVDRIQEILQAPPLHYIPRAPEAFLGAINVHGSPRTVVDLARFLGFQATVRDPRIIVLTPGCTGVGLAVSELGAIVPLDPELVLPRQEGTAASHCIRAVLQQDEGMINLLDLEQVRHQIEALCDAGDER